MATSPDEGQFLSMLLKLIKGKNTMEIGVYTGYSLLATALALPQDGKILAMDINRENYELGLPIIQNAGVSDKIDFREGLKMIIELWNGSVVAPPDAPLMNNVKFYRDFVLELNMALAVDPRIEICQLPVGDGITLCRHIS
ncbi:unnamed protein product [Prunus brigantina]